MAKITTLIDKQDTFEVVRDQIAAILAIELANQRVLAKTAGKDPDRWDAQIYLERADPWILYQNSSSAAVPIVNVWYDSGDFPGNQGDTVERQAHHAIYNIDCYGAAVAADDSAGGHVVADEAAAFQAHRTVRLVRNILMSSFYTYLGLRGTVWKRWVEGINVFQAPIEAASIRVLGVRLRFAATFNEFSPQTVPVILETLAVDIRRTEDGKIIAQAEYDLEGS